MYLVIHLISIKFVVVVILPSFEEGVEKSASDRLRDVFFSMDVHTHCTLATQKPKR